jgi:glycosyltransferase involved in cell wall biosynthesis
MARTTPTISVVIPFYNGSRFISEALATVDAQTLPPLEVIVVDDGSRPEEARALDRAAAEAAGAARIVAIHLPRNASAAAARNLGIGLARGEWIAFLDCDDLWEPTKLERQMALVVATPDCRAVHCGIRSRHLDGVDVIYRKRDISFEDFTEFPCPVLPSAVIAERQALLLAGLFDPTKRCCDDLDLFTRFALKVGKFHCVPEPLTIRRMQEGSLSGNIKAFWSEAAEIYRNLLPYFADRARAEETLRHVHAWMALRAIYLGEYGLVRRMVRSATRPDVSRLSLAVRILRGAWRNRLRRWRGLGRSVEAHSEVVGDGVADCDVGLAVPVEVPDGQAVREVPHGPHVDR